MSDTATAEATEAESGGKGKLFAIIGVALVAVLAGVWFFVLAPSGEEGAAPEEPPAPTFSTDPGPIVLVDDTTVSLGGDQPHFAAVKYSAVLAMDAEQGLVEGQFGRLRSAAQLVFRGYDAATLDTPEGLLQLQADLTAKAEELWPNGEVLEVLVESLLVQ